MKRIRFILLAAVMLATITLPAFGSNENPDKGSLPVITGEVTSVDNGSFTVKDYWEGEHTFTVSEDTRCVEKIIEADEIINQQINCDEISVGDYVSVQYVEQEEGEDLAIRVNVDADLVHFPLLPSE